MNSDSGNPEKVFTLNRNKRSRSTRIGVHLGPEYASEVRFRALAAKGDLDKGLKLLDKLDTHFSKD